MTIAEMRELFEYDRWANGRVFAAAESLTEDQLSAEVASSFSSVRATLGHLVGAGWIWLRRWRGESPAAPAWARHGDLAELRRQLAALELDRTDFLAGLTDADLERAFAYQNLKGEPQNDRLGGTLQHVVNHSTYHRGQVATQLRQLGSTPPNTDLIAFLRSRK